MQTTVMRQSGMPTAWTRLGGSSAPSGGSRPRGMHASPQSWIVAESAEGARSTTQKLGSAPSSPHPSNTRSARSAVATCRRRLHRTRSGRTPRAARKGAMIHSVWACIAPVVHRQCHTRRKSLQRSSAVQCVWSVTTLDNWIALPLEAIVATCSAPLSSARARVASVGCQAPVHRAHRPRAFASVGHRRCLPRRQLRPEERHAAVAANRAASLTSASVASSALRASANGEPPPISTSTLCSVAAAASVERPPGELRLSPNSDSHAHRKPLARPRRRHHIGLRWQAVTHACLRFKVFVVDNLAVALVGVGVDDASSEKAHEVYVGRRLVRHAGLHAPPLGPESGRESSAASLSASATGPARARTTRLTPTQARCGIESESARVCVGHAAHVEMQEKAWRSPRADSRAHTHCHQEEATYRTCNFSSAFARTSSAPWRRCITVSSNRSSRATLSSSWASTRRAVRPRRNCCPSLGLPRRRLGNKSTADQPYAWEAREFLRRRSVGKRVTFEVESQGTANRAFGSVYFEDGSSLATLMVSSGWAKPAAWRACRAGRSSCRRRGCGGPRCLQHRRRARRRP